MTPDSSRNWPDQVGPHVGVRDGLRHQIPQVDHLHSLLPEAVGKGVVLPLGLLQIGDVIKEQPLQILRHQIFQLTAGAVEQDLFQPPDLGGIVNSGFQKAHSFVHRKGTREIALV